MRQARIADEAFLTLITRIAGVVLGVVSTIVMARALGAEGRGTMAVVVAVVTLGQYVSAQGLSHGQFRVWSRKIASQEVLITAGAWLSAAAGVVAAGLIWALYAIGPGSFLASVKPIDLALLAASLPIWVHLILIRDVVIMRGGLMQTNLALLAGAAVRFVGVVVLAAAGKLTVETALAMIVVSVVVPWAAMCRMAGLTLRSVSRPPPRSVLRREAALGGELAPAFFLQQLNLRLDVLIVAELAGLKAAGIYAVAVVVSQLAWLATDSLTYTVRAKQASSDEPRAADITAKAVRMNVLLALGIAVAVAGVMPVLVAPLLGVQFSSATGVVWALVPGAVAMAPWRTLNIALVRFTRPWIVPLVTLGAVVVGIGLCWWWVQPWGAVGAGFACSAGYVIGAIMAGVVFCRVTGLPGRQLLPGPADIQRLVSLVDIRRRRVKVALGR